MNAANHAPPTSLAAMLEGPLGSHPGQSCHVLLADNRLALLARLALADQATRTIDIQYYIIRGDLTGLLLMHRLVQAADRGVEVRVLVDDVGTIGQDPMIAAFAEHPHIRVRLFNAFQQRHPWTIVRLWEAWRSKRRLTQRMHNKAFVVDELAAIVGGRNVGDEYFDAGAQFNFQDLDVIAFGPAAAAVTESFECFWTSPAAKPIGKIATEKTASLGDVRSLLSANFTRFSDSDYLAALRDGQFLDELAEEAKKAYWGKAEVVFDDPTKIDPEYGSKRRRWRKRRARMTPRIVELLASAQREVTLISPYFVPGARGAALFKSLRARGVQVRVLTNSLAATDVPAVHAGYERYRRRLLKYGVEIWEMRPDPGQPKRRTFRTSSGASLHAKAFTVDQRLSFVGSMNMDPRSAFLNTELGIIVDSEALARRIDSYYDGLAQLNQSYRVRLERVAGIDRMRWDWIDATGAHRNAHHEPGASWDRRLISQVIALLPLERHL